MPSELWQFLFLIAVAVALILALILALEDDIRQNSPPKNTTAGDQQDNASGKLPFPHQDAAARDNYSKAPVQYFIDKSRLIFEIIVAVFVAGYTITQVQQLSVNRDTERRQLRAYVIIEKASVSIDGRIIKGFLDLKNFGQTPAYDLTTKTRMQTWPKDEPFVFMGFERVKLDKSIVGPGMVINPGVSDLPIPDDNQVIIPALKQMQARVFLVGEAKYTDAFGRRWALNFRFRGAQSVGNGWLMEPTEDGNGEIEDR